MNKCLTEIISSLGLTTVTVFYHHFSWKWWHHFLKSIYAVIWSSCRYGYLTNLVTINSHKFSKLLFPVSWNIFESWLMCFSKFETIWFMAIELIVSGSSILKSSRTIFVGSSKSVLKILAFLKISSRYLCRRVLR